LEVNVYQMSSKLVKSPFRILQLSDLHMGSETTDYDLISDQCRLLKPDLIVVTGDTFDDRSDVDNFYRFFFRLDANVPMINILGNWDYGTNMKMPTVLEHFKRVGLQTLINRNISLNISGNEISIVGLDDLRMGNPRLKKALNGAKDAAFSLLLHHCPAEFHRVIFIKDKEPLSLPDFDLVLAGHTHGGQINFWGYRPILPLGSGGFVQGWYETNSLKMYVNRGLGCTAIPMRLEARPEIAVFDIKPLYL
jgi:uncharacterized protein